MTKKKKQQNKRAAERNNKICIVTRNAYPRTEMLRFVISDTGQVIFDANEKLPGAGLWVYADKETLEKAINKKMFSKAAGQAVKTQEDLFSSVVKRLQEEVLQLLGMARKSGALVFGYEGVKKSIDQIAVAFEAQDSAQNGRKKLYRPNDNFPCCTYFTREELGRITGQEEQVHTAVVHSPIAKRILQTVEKLDRLSDQTMKG